MLAAACQPSTNLHYTSNGNFSGSTYTPAWDRFNLADVSSVGMVNSLPSGVKGLVYIGQCSGVTPSFTNAVQPFLGNARVFGFYLMDEPDPTGRYSALCPPANLKAESDYIHYFFGSAKTFIIEMNLGASSAPTYAGGYTPGNSDIDLYGLDPYPCRSELNGCNDNIITLAVKAAESAGIPEADIVPVYQAFGGGYFADDGGGQWILPTARKRRPSSTPGGRSSPPRSSTTPTPGGHNATTSPCRGPRRSSRCSPATTRDHPAPGAEPRWWSVLWRAIYSPRSFSTRLLIPLVVRETSRHDPLRRCRLSIEICRPP